MRRPRSPGYGGRSSPAASRFSRTHCTMRATFLSSPIEQRFVRQTRKQCTDRRGQADTRRLAQVIPKAAALLHEGGSSGALHQQRRDREIEVSKGMLERSQWLGSALEHPESVANEGRGGARRSELRQAPQPAQTPLSGRRSSSTVPDFSSATTM